MRRRTILNLALGAIALALGVWVVVDRPADAGRVARSVVPELAGARIETVKIAWRDRPPFSFEPDDPRWEQARVRALVDSLALLAERRHSESLPADVGLSPPRLAVQLDLEGGAVIALSFGDEVAAVRGVWMVRADRPGFSLVDAHVLQDLDVDRNSLRVRRVLVDENLPGHPLPLDPAQLQELARLAAALEVDAPLPVGLPAQPLRTYYYGAQKLEQLGDCPDGAIAIRSARTEGCVARARFQPLAERLAALADRPDSFVDRRWFRNPGETIDVRLSGDANGKVLRLADQPVREWLGKLEELTRTESVAFAGDTPLVSLSSGDETTVVFENPLRRVRTGEPRALLLDPAAEKLLFAPAYTFLPLSLSSRDPVDLAGASLSVAGKVVETYQRGAILDPSDEPAVHAARLTALRVVAAQPAPAHGLDPAARQVTLTFDPPPGQTEPEQLVIRVGRSSPAGCFATTSVHGLDGPVFELDGPACSVLRGPWTGR